MEVKKQENNSQHMTYIYIYIYIYLNPSTLQQAKH